jgi:hypothetical protein
LLKNWLLGLPVAALLAGPAPTPPAPTLTLRDGRTFELKAPPRQEGGRVIFTTTAGKTYSLDAADVLSLGAPPTPTSGPKKLDPLDSHELGAIARQERANTGKTTDLTARHPTRAATRTARKTPKATRTPSPTRTPTASSR